MLLDQLAALTLGHAAPDAEPDLIVERFDQTLGNHRTLAAYDSGSSLGGATDEEFVGISGATPRPRNPSEAAFGGGDG
jgi:hypothetical protein